MEIEKIKHGSEEQRKPRFILNSIVNSDGVEEVQFVNVKKLANEFIDSVKKDKKEIDHGDFVKGFSDFILKSDPETDFGKALKDTIGKAYLKNNASSVYVLCGTNLDTFELIKKECLSRYDKKSIEYAKEKYQKNIDNIRNLSDISLDTGYSTLDYDGTSLNYDKVKTNSSGVRKYYKDGQRVKSVYPDGSVHYSNVCYDFNGDSYSETKYSSSDYVVVNTYFNDGMNIESVLKDGIVTNKYGLNQSGQCDYYSKSKDGNLISEFYELKNNNFPVSISIDNSGSANERVSLSTKEMYGDSNGSHCFDISGSDYKIDSLGNINVYKTRADGKGDYLAYSISSSDSSSNITEYSLRGDVINSYSTSTSDEGYLWYN